MSTYLNPHPHPPPTKQQYSERRAHPYADIERERIRITTNDYPNRYEPVS